MRVPNHLLTGMILQVSVHVLPRKLNMEPKNSPPWKRRSHLETSMFRFYLKLWGCKNTKLIPMLVNIPVPSDFMSDFNFMDVEVRNSYLSLQKVLFLEEKQQHLLVYCPWNLVHVGWSISIKEIYFISG